MSSLDPHRSTALLPPGGRWAVAVSGGADSVALLCLLYTRGDLSLHVVHLDHQTRGLDSTADAEWVIALATSFALPCTVRTRAEMEAAAGSSLPTNLSARFRALRLALFRDVATAHALDGVVLGHHADDVAETVLHRLLRGSAANGLTGVEPRAMVAGVTVARPLLTVRREALREYLKSIGQVWREDASNASPRYGRNRLRALLTEKPELTRALLDLSAACRPLRDWVRSAAPVLPETFAVRVLRDLPEVLGRESARRWLVERGAPPDELSPAVLDRLVCLASDAAIPPRQHFPGGILVRRRRGQVFALSPAPASVSAAPKTAP